MLEDSHRSCHMEECTPHNYTIEGYFWPRLRKDVMEYLSRCLEVHLAKAKHQHASSLLQPLPIPEWKWETVSLDFITGLPHTRKQHDSIIVVLDKLRKTAHFILAKSTYKTMEITNIFMKEIFRIHGIPKVPHKWEDYLHLVEFAYNNEHHESLGMIPLEVLYGRKCRVPVDWNNPVNKLALGPNMLAEMDEVVKKVRQNLRAA
eukprot:PITA_09191